MRTLNINVDQDLGFLLEKFSTTTGAFANATSEATVSLRFAQTPTGAALASLEKSATEQSITVSGATKIWYHATWDSATELSGLAAYVGTVVYLVVRRANDFTGIYEPFRLVTSTEAF